MRQRLLDAALGVLQHEGAAALTVRNITERAGCSTTGIYTYFGGKHGLVEAIFLNGFESFDDALTPHYRSGDLASAGRAYRRWARANPIHYLVMFGRAVPDFEPSERAAERAAQSFQSLVDAVAARSTADGDSDPLAAAYHLYATVHGYVMLELVGMGPAEARRLDELYEDGLGRALRGIGLR
ncbi:MAG: TetR/AcrR family transcriptional regulator [Acidimicrobiia bacterium]|nr:TetR/AcrR family transcriptional regulator [Acidimicrobiia bacterium]